MPNTAIHFGAGAIGRGFIGKLIADAGWDLIFVDVNEALINYLKENKTYQVNIASPAQSVESVTIKDAIILSDLAQLAKAGCQAHLITCAVGPNILPILAKTLAAMILERQAQGLNETLHVIACENMIRASSALKKYVLDNLEASAHSYVEQYVSFVDSAVDRIVPPQEHAHMSADVLVEEFYEWIVDQTQIKPGFVVPGAQNVDNLLAYIERKLFIVNGGHATCAYFGRLYGHQTIDQSMADPKVSGLVESVMNESVKTLVAHYKMSAIELLGYVRKILERFRNPYLKDETTRVGRQPLRKLAADERFILPLRRAIEYKLTHEYLDKAVAAAMLFDYAEDPESKELQAKLKEKDVASVLNVITENALPSEVVQNIVRAYEQFQNQ